MPEAHYGRPQLRRSVRLRIWWRRKRFETRQVLHEANRSGATTAVLVLGSLLVGGIAVAYVVAWHARAG